MQGLLGAICHGTDVVFLTGDALMMEQFLKMCDLVASDYAACAFARSHERIVEEHANRVAVSPADGALKRLYESKVTCLNLHEDWMQTTFPKNPYVINLHCWLLGAERDDERQFAAMTFCAERPMYRLLFTKGHCGGRNIANAAGCNLRMSCSLVGGPGETASLGRDRIVPYGSRSFPRDERLDLRIEGLPAADLSKVIFLGRGFTAPF